MAFSSLRKVLSLAVLGSVMAACSSKAQAPQSLILNDFERVPDPALARRQFDPAEAPKKPMYPHHDFDVSTSGYATLTPIDKAAARAAKDKALYQFIVGQSAGKVRFSVPGDYKKKGDEHFPLQWESGLTLSIDSHTPLKATDWSSFQYLAVPVFNPGPLTQTVRLRINDSGSAMTQTSALAPLGEAVLEFPLQMLSDARLNASDIKGMTLYLDTAGQDKDPVLIFDEIGLHSLSAQERAKLAQEEGGDQTDDEADWDSEDEGAVRNVVVMRPGQTTPWVDASQASADSGTAKAQ
jgi:hypothetical protein